MYDPKKGQANYETEDTLRFILKVTQHRKGD